jgi:hypothetical protein
MPEIFPTLLQAIAHNPLITFGNGSDRPMVILAEQWPMTELL